VVGECLGGMAGANTQEFELGSGDVVIQLGEEVGNDEALLGIHEQYVCKWHKECEDQGNR